MAGLLSDVSKTVRTEERNDAPTPWMILYVRLLEYSIEMAQRFEPWGEPTQEARIERAWLAGTLRGTPVVSSDLCLEIAEPEIRMRIHKRYGRCRSRAEYRQRALAEIDATWERERRVAKAEGRDVLQLAYVLEQLRFRSERIGQLCLFCA
jgi:hypothetical protein